MIQIEEKQKLLIEYSKKITKLKEKIKEYEIIIKSIEQIETNQVEIK